MGRDEVVRALNDIHLDEDSEFSPILRLNPPLPSPSPFPTAPLLHSLHSSPNINTRDAEESLSCCEVPLEEGRRPCWISWVPLIGQLRALSVCYMLFVLFCFVLFCFVLFCFVLFCFVLFCIVLFCFVLFCLFCIVLYCIVLFHFLHFVIWWHWIKY